MRRSLASGRLEPATKRPSRRGFLLRWRVSSGEPVLLRDAESQARRRGDKVVSADHLALALARPDSPGEPVLRATGTDPLDWRDEIVTVLGWTEGAAAARMGRPAGSVADSPSARWFDGALELAPDVSRVLELAEVEAAANGTEVGAAHLLVGLLLDGESVGAATATWLGLTVAQVRSAANLRSERRVIAGGHPPGRVRRGPDAGPLVLCGGAPDGALLSQVLRLARNGAASGPQVVVVDVGSSRPCGDPAYSPILEEFRTAGAARAVDSGIAERPDASSAEVCERLAAADVLWFRGGDPAAIYDRLWATPALDAIERAHGSGALLGGVSAGATIWGIGTLADLAAGHPEPFSLFGALDDIVVFAHYWPTRERAFRERLGAFPGCRGLAVAHGGAVVVGDTTDQLRVLRAGSAGTPNVTLADPDGDVVAL